MAESTNEEGIDDGNHNDIERLVGETDPAALVACIYQIGLNWASFEMRISSPVIPFVSNPQFILPEQLSEAHDMEFVYPIYDHGDRLCTSKALDTFVTGRSMCKLYYTIEKMLAVLIDRLKSGGIDTETEVLVSFEGHPLAQRKAFESIINLNYNVIVTNFDPSAWGENYLEVVKRLASKGYGYPPEAPRDNYRQVKQQRGPAKGTPNQ